jgi:ribosome-associated protein
MSATTFKLNNDEDFITLINLLKIKQLAQTGGHAKLIVDQGLVHVNGEIETQKRKKLKSGDLIKIENKTIEII